MTISIDAGRRASYLRVAVVAVFSVLLAIRMFDLIDRYAVNVFYSDQWDLYTPILEGSSVWELFRWTHGPARQGVGLVVTAILGELTGMNVRAEAFAAGTILCICTVIALYLRKRLFGQLGFADIAIPLMFFSLSQEGTIVTVPMISYGAVPLLLLLMTCLAWLDSSAVRRVTIVSVLNFLLLHSVWGLFAMPATILIFGKIVRERRSVRDIEARAAAAGLGASILSLGIFLYDFRPGSGAECFALNSWEHLRAPAFMSVMFARFVGLMFSYANPTALAAGGVILLILSGLFLLHGTRFLRLPFKSEPRSLSIFFLVSFSLLFSLAASTGRVCLSLSVAQASRYMTLLIPGFLALYFSLLLLRTGWLRRVGLGLLILGLAAGTWAWPSFSAGVAWESRKRAEWKRCYLRTGDELECEKEAGFRIYPRSGDLESRLEYLRANRLNLFQDAPLSDFNGEPLPDQ